ncbi:MAG: Protein TolB [Chloroflexi bacterium]|nr:Protein TolB [Chloroflexota bacterium]
MKKYALIVLVLFCLLIAGCDQTAATEPPPKEEAPEATDIPTEPPPPPTDTSPPPTATNTAIPPTQATAPHPETVIVFTSNKSDNPKVYGLYFIDVETLEITPLDTGLDNTIFPRWSPDRSQVLFALYDVWNLYTIQANGTEVTQITDYSSNNGDWSPDGSQIVFQSDHQNEPEDTPDIYITDSDGGNMVEILDEPDVVDFMPRWSPDGEKILFISGRDGGTNIYSMNTDGSEITQVTKIGFVATADWSPDGSKIAFAAGMPTTNIYIIDKDGNPDSLVTLTDDEFTNSSPSWTLMGEKIVFQSNRSGNYDLWIINADDTDLTQLTDGEYSDIYPNW